MTLHVRPEPQPQRLTCREHIIAVLAHDGPVDDGGWRWN